jgi:hypothetical protein
MATGMIFNDARVRLTTTTCYWFGSTYTNGASTANGMATSMYYDITPFTQSVRLALDSEPRDNTVMGNTYRKQLTALRSATVELRCLQSYASVAEPVETSGGTTGQSLDRLVYSLYEAESPFFISVRPDNAVRSSCNPEWILPVVLGSHTAMDGAVADLLVTPLRFTSQGAVTRETCST